MSGLFGRNRPVYLESSGYRRRRTVPKWVPVLGLGAALGAGAVLYWQQQGPRRLTLEESAVFQTRAERAEAELLQTAKELDETRRRLEAAKAEAGQAIADAKAARKGAETLKQDLALVGELLPPDPRGGAVGVRTARFSTEGAAVAWQALLTREAAAGRLAKGVVEVSVVGRRANGQDGTVTPEPAPIAFEGLYLRAQGRVELPEGFAARQATIRVLDAEGGRVLGMRVFNLR